MIDREARTRAAALLRRFADGEITNEDFYADYPRSPQDSALRAVFDEAWFYYSDLKTHYLVGEHALDEETRVLFMRCTLFLLSDLEYEYPKASPVSILTDLAATILSLGLYRFLGFHNRRHAARIKAAGDIEVWPFLSREDYQAMKAKFGEGAS